MTLQSLLGKKIGMTQVFKEDGRVQPVTVIKTGTCLVTQVKTEAKDGYTAVQIGFNETKKLNSPEKGHLSKVGKQFRNLKEFRVLDLSDIQVGQEIKMDFLEPGDLVNVKGTSKGRGFAGGVKRYGFKGGPKTHGQSDRHRAPGSIGSGTYPGRVWKGQKMAGHMGNVFVTTRNLEVVQADIENDLLLLKGSVPGGKNSLLIIEKSSNVKGNKS